MSEIHLRASRSIQTQNQSLAQAIVAMQYANFPDVCFDIGEKRFEKSIRDTTYHLEYLSQALAVGSPLLFIQYSEWCKILFTYLGFSDDLLLVTLRCLREVILDKLDEEQALVVCDFIDAVINRPPAPVVSPPSFLSSDAPFGELAQDYLHALLHKDRAAARQLILDAVQQGTDIQDIYLHVLQPCQRELGRLWHINRVSVAEEHYATAVTQSIMAQLYPMLFSSAPSAKVGAVVVACVSGELHELGARMLADFFEMDGWDSFFLGANTPQQGIIEMVRANRAALLCLSVSTTMRVSQVSALIEALRAAPGCAGTRILVGGNLFNLIPNLWQQVGADGYASDARTALSIARELVTQEQK